MKGNQFKTTKSQSFGYEPKEYARHNRQVNIRRKQDDALLKYIKKDSVSLLYQYEKYITTIVETIHSNSVYLSKNTIYYNIEKYEAYKCYCYLKYLEKEKGIKLDYTFDEKFNEYYKIEQRRVKIDNIKNKIKEKTEK